MTFRLVLLAMVGANLLLSLFCEMVGADMIVSNLAGRLSLQTLKRLSRRPDTRRCRKARSSSWEPTLQDQPTRHLTHCSQPLWPLIPPPTLRQQYLSTLRLPRLKDRWLEY